MFDGLVNTLKKRYNFHTLIVYGSFAKGNFDEESDIDMIAFREDPEPLEDKSWYEGRQLDLWVYSDTQMNTPESYLHVKDGVVLLDEKQLACPFLEAVEDHFQKGPEKISFQDKKNRIEWQRKMLKRTLKQDLEGCFRLHWLLTDSLQIYFEIIEKWYLGSKSSFEWLEANDPEGLIHFKKAYLSPSYESIQALIDFMDSRIKA